MRHPILNEVLSITAQEYGTTVVHTVPMLLLLNEVLSITAQECAFRIEIEIVTTLSSMKS